MIILCECYKVSHENIKCNTKFFVSMLLIRNTDEFGIFHTLFRLINDGHID